MSISNEEWFLRALTDFSDLKPRNQQLASIKQKKYNGNEFDLDLQANEKLLKSFKEIKQKLKQSTKQNQQIKHKLIEKQEEIQRLKHLQKDVIRKTQQYVKQNKQLKDQNQDFRQKINYAKQSLRSKKQLSDELQLYKLKMNQQIQTIENLQKQKQKTVQVSIVQKLELQQKIKKLEIKCSGDHSYIQQIQIAMNKIKTKNIQLQTELKKMEIKYDQQIYHQKWLSNGYEKQQLELSLKQTQKQLNNIVSKYNRDKDKRTVLEKRVLELQEISSLWTLKAETYQKQSKSMSKKIKKMTKSLEQAQMKVEQVLGDCLFWQEKFLKSVAICEELTSRVKRQLIGDAANLAKTCEFKLNKLKQEERRSKYLATKSPSLAKKQNQKTRSKSYYCLPHTPTKRLFDNIIENNKKQTKEEDRALTQTKKNNINQLQIKTQKPSQNQSTIAKYDSIEIKIRKQRQQMERKIRQKMLYNRIDVTTSSPQKHYLRSQYLRLMNV